MTDFPTLLYTWSTKKVPFLGGATPIIGSTPQDFSSGRDIVNE